MIQAQGLTKQFESVLAVDGIDLDIPEGEVLALLGPNGAGKTTTVRMLTSVLRPTGGSAQVAGYDVVKQPEQVRSVVGVLTEMHGLYGRMPADDYLDFFGKVYGMETQERRKQIERLLREFGLYEVRRRPIGEYSKGMRQKLALARAMIHNPRVLLLDEPTSAMDPESARLVRNSIHELRSAKRTIIICTHNLAEAEELSDQIAIIRRGRIIARGAPDQLKNELLGLPAYQVQFTASSEQAPSLPAGLTPLESGPDWLRFRSDNPRAYNPQVLHSLAEQGFGVLSLQEVSRSLERVYLQAVNAADEALPVDNEPAPAKRRKFFFF